MPIVEIESDAKPELMGLPDELLKPILMSLDYPSFCQLRSTCRRFLNFVTEAEVHKVFLSIEIEQGNYSFQGRDGKKCTGCAVYCEATAAQIRTTDRQTRRARRKYERAKNAQDAASTLVKDAHGLLRTYKTALEETEAEQETREYNEKILKIQDLLDSAEDIGTTEMTIALQALRDETAILDQSQDHARTCSECKRRYNHHRKPGVLELNTNGWDYWAAQNYCSWAHHDVGSVYYQRPCPKQKDGKICRICWKSTGREASGMHRRRLFMEEYGYWLRDSWLKEGQAVQAKAELVANKSFEQIELEEAEAALNKNL